MTGPMQLLWRLLRGQRQRYLAAMGAMLLSTLFLFLAPLIPGAVLDGALAGEPKASNSLLDRIVGWMGGPEWIRNHLGLAGLLVVASTALGGVFAYLRGRYAAQASERIARGLRDELYDHIQHLPASYHDRAEVGDLVQRCTSDVETLLTFLMAQVVEIGRAGVMLLVAIPLMVAIDARMTLAAVSLVPLIVLFGTYFYGRVQKLFQKIDESEGRLSARLQESLTGIRVVRAFARQAHEEERFGERIAEYRDGQIRLMKSLSVFWAASDLTCFSQIGVVLFYGASRLAEGTLQVGALWVFMAYLGMYLWPVQHLGRILTDLGKAVVALRRIGQVLSEPREPAGMVQVRRAHSLVSTAGARDKADGPVASAGRVVFDKVGFSHGDVRVLDGISFEVTPGETVALLGPSGSGKSTLMHILMRLYDSDEGQILLDGEDIRMLDRKDVRSRVAAVMQEPFLYARTLRENIKMGRWAASDVDMLATARAASIHDSVLTLPKGYDTLLGERGYNLSGGQRQRVALARALLLDAPVLVLDDALSAVDTETEEAILEALRVRRGKHTTLLIAHRLSTLMEADRIVVLEAGKVAQEGTHETLLKEEGRYQRLWHIQGNLESDLQRELEAV